MAINYQPEIGTVLLCDFSGMIVPEMQKKRPVVVLSSVATHLCIVVALSTTDPEEEKPWHGILNTPKNLPAPYDAKTHWVKGDMVYTVSFKRLSLPTKGKDKFGTRLYVKSRVDSEQMEMIKQCILSAIFPKGIDKA